MAAMTQALVRLSDLLASADIVSLHCPLTPATRHLIDQAALARMRRGAMLINTSRGAVIDTPAVIAALKDGRLGHLGLDVYEEEADLFFEDLELPDMVKLNLKETVTFKPHRVGFTTAGNVTANIELPQTKAYIRGQKVESTGGRQGRAKRSKTRLATGASSPAARNPMRARPGSDSTRARPN